ncbi:MAG: PLP-dependent aminotransferase family protein [Calditrichaeota bacterium]|nr:PLP-dependent aminotransferase family protein [Calditrichota bacterium]
MLKRETLPYAEWTYRIPEGEIRRLLKYQVKYYFGGGLPGALPIRQLAGIIEEIGRELLSDIGAGNKASSLQLFNYNKTPGLDSLRKLFLKRLVERQHLPFDPETDYHRVLVTNGAQQALYGLLDSIINPGDYILSAAPSYLGFVTPAVKLGGNVVCCPSDENGLTVEGVEKAIAAVKREAGTVPKILYIVSDSDNPSGTTLPQDRRKAFFEIAQRENILIVEDGAYKEIQFGKKRLNPIKAYDTENRVVVYLASTSKEAGVLRIGYGVYPAEIGDMVEKAKGYYDLCSPVLNQVIAERYYSLDLDQILGEVLGIYRERCGAMLEALGSFFPKGIMTRPTGGFFVWWETLPGVNFDSKTFNEKVAIPNNLLFVPSHAFFPPEGLVVDARGKLVSAKPHTNGMRLSFSAVPKERIFEGIEIMGNLLKKHLKQL